MFKKLLLTALFLILGLPSYTQIITTIIGHVGSTVGDHNSISAGSVHGFIGGGKCNVINAHCSAILGGYCNTISGVYSAIFGGSGNIVPATSNYVGIFGCNITNVTNCTLHTNCMVVQNIPPTSGGFAPPAGAIPGTLYYVSSGGFKQVYVA